MKSQKTSLVFTGDIGFDRYMSGRWTDKNLLSEEILAFLHSGDHVVSNVEGALMDTTNDTSGRGVYFHAMHPDAASFLSLIRTDIWNISNNHIMDAGKEGLENTRAIAARMNCRTIGAGMNIQQAMMPVYLDEAGGIGLFGVAYLPECIPATDTKPGSFSWNEFERIKATISDIKARCRWCVIVVHGSEEFSSMPMPYIRERYLKYLTMGADVIVAHHPHVVQNYETFEDGKAIFYSLGNFIFDTDYQRAQHHTDQGVLLKLIFGENAFTFEGFGMRLIRGEERLVSAPLPAIFSDIREDDYRMLSPLAAQALVSAEKRRMIYLDAARYSDADDDTWNAYFDSDQIEDYIKGEYMDFVVIRNFIAAHPNSWENCSRTDVIQYLKNQL